MERRLVRLPRPHRSVLVHRARRAEDRPAELHAALDDACTVIADDPLERVVREGLSGRRRRVDERDLVKAQADLSVRGVGEVVEFAEQRDVRRWESGIGLELLEEDD